MTSIVEWAVHNTRLVLVLIAVVVIAGILAYIQIPKESNPDVPFPILAVTVTYPGISPEDSERLLVKPLETNLRTVEGLKEITARAYQGAAVIILEFDVNFDKQKALQDVRAQVDMTRALLPQEADPPFVREFNAGLFPVITVALSGNVPERTLLKLARDLSDRLKAIPTVLDADLSGEREELLEIVIDPQKLELYGLTQGELFSAIANNNRLIPAGSMDNGHGSFAVKVPGVIVSAQDVLSLPLRSTTDMSVTLQDVASVRRTFKDATGYARMDGQPTIAIDVTKRIGANVIATNERVREIVGETSEGWPPGVKAHFMFDQSAHIRNQLGSLSDSIVLAIILVLIIVVAALGLRSGLLVGVAIPTSFLMAFLVMNSFGVTVNFVIMFGMLLAVGILVDGAIIVVEYAERKMTEGHSPKLAFSEAAIRMFWPVVSATATMIFAFLPMMMWPGVSGKFMSYFPITLVIILCSSMIVALVFLPVLGGFFGRKPPHDEQHERAIHASETGDWHDIPGITGWYAHMAEKLALNPVRVMWAAGGVVLLVVGLFTLFNKGTEFFVETDPEQASVLVQARGNLSARETRDIVMDVARRISDVQGIQSIYATTGGDNFALSGQGGIPVDNIGRVTIELKHFTERGPGKDILEAIRKKTASIPGVHIEIRVPDGGPPVGKAVMIEVSSDHPQDLQQVTQMIRNHMDTLPQLRDVEDTRPLPGIEWNMDINRDMASRFGANAQSIGTAVQLVTTGVLVGKYRPEDVDDEIDIRVRYPESERGIHALDTLRLPTARGVVPISNFVERKPAQQVTSIERVNGYRVYHVRANMVPGTILPSAQVAELKQWISTQTIPSTVKVKFKGADEAENESGTFLLQAGFLALFLIAVVLLALFNSFYHAGLIMIAVILAMIGALLGMVVMQQTFSITMTGTGMLALAGIVVNHNIVLIDTFQRLRNSGMEPIEAVIRSSAQRLRPVFLTTITAMGGLLPMMFALEINFITREVIIGGPAAKTWVQLSTAIVFGLGFSKLITLGLMPAMMAWPYMRKGRKASRQIEGIAKAFGNSGSGSKARESQAAE